MLTAKLEAPGLKKTLGKLMDQLTNKLPLFKTWGRAVELKAKANARNYGGRRIWRNIAGATRCHSITRDGAVVECYDPIGTHKERGGPIRARNAKALTIPISALARGRRVSELRDRGIDVFRLPKSNVLGRNVGKGKNKTFEPLYALCKHTAPQRKFPWWPDQTFVLRTGVEHAEKHLKLAIPRDGTT